MSDDAIRFEPKRLPGYSRVDLIDEIRRVVDKEFQSRIPNTTQFKSVSRVSLNSIQRTFGSYSKAMTEAGFAYTKRQVSVSRKKHTTEEVLSNLRHILSLAGGYEFSLDFYRKNGGLFKTRSPIKEILGLSWKAALQKIGAKKHAQMMYVTEHSQRRKLLASVTESDLLKELDDVWQAIGHYPSRAGFKCNSKKFDAALYERRFGSWSRAINALCKSKGIPMPRINGAPVKPKADGGNTSKEVLIDELKSILSTNRNGGRVTFEVYKKSGGTYSIATFQHHFGGWAKAMEAVGRLPGHIRYSKDQLFDEMQRLWEQLGRQPLFREMDENGNISGSTYHKTFGSWIKAVHAFCEDRNSESALLAPPDQLSPDASLIKPSDIKNECDIFNTESSPIIILRKTGRSVPLRLRWRVLQRDNFTCKACGRNPEKHGIVLHADHIKAWSLGGETVFENLQTLCMECNLGKSDLS